MDDRRLAHLELSLQQAGRRLQYPPTPDLARPDTPRRTRPAFRLAWVAVAAVVAASLLAVPTVRARVLAALQVGGIHISLPPEGLSKFIATKPFAKGTEHYGQIVPLAELQGAVSLEEARRRAGFELSLPSYPVGLGEPDQVYLQGQAGMRFVILVWLESDSEDKVQLALYILGPGVGLNKGTPEAVQRVWVHDSLGALVIGNHFLQTNGEKSLGVLVHAPALIWQLGELTYRLESNLPVHEMLRIAESIK